jgi:hypothetical protein
MMRFFIFIPPVSAENGQIDRLLNYYSTLPRAMEEKPRKPEEKTDEGTANAVPSSVRKRSAKVKEYMKKTVLFATSVFRGKTAPASPVRCGRL